MKTCKLKKKKKIAAELSIFYTTIISKVSLKLEIIFSNYLPAIVLFAHSVL